MAHYKIAKLTGKAGGGFIFDTNSIHRGEPKGSLARTTLVLEYHSAVKCPVVLALGLAIPCPSGDQRLVPAEHGVASITSTPPSDEHPPTLVAPHAYVGAGTCVHWIRSHSVTAGLVPPPAGKQGVVTMLDVADEVTVVFRQSL